MHLQKNKRAANNWTYADICYTFFTLLIISAVFYFSNGVFSQNSSYMLFDIFNNFAPVYVKSIGKLFKKHIFRKIKIFFI